MPKKRRKRPGKAEAKLLPSGSWRVRMTCNGQTRSFTADTKNEAEYAANRWAYSETQRHKNRSKLTVEQAMTEYIDSRTNANAPSGLRSYRGIVKNAIDAIKDIPIADITKQDIQEWVNSSAEHYAPKTVKTQFGLLRATLNYFDIDLKLTKIRLPDMRGNDRPIPTEKDMEKILQIVKGTSVELAVTIAVTLGLRQGEIAALKWADYDGQSLNIHAEFTLNEDGKYEFQERTKSAAGKRVIAVPPILKERLDKAERKSEFISPMLPSSVLRKFHKLCDQHGLPRFRMHDNRHANATVMLAHGIPDKYAMQRLGQSSQSMLKNVYQHLSDEMIEKTSQMMSEVFEELAKDDGDE